MSCANEHNHGDDHHDHHDHDHSHEDDITPAIQSSLYEYIDFDGIRTLNEDVIDSGKAIIKKTWEERLEDEPTLKSDSDEELLVFIPFTGLVKLHSLLIRAPPDTTSPQLVELFINRDDIDFSTVGDLIPTQSLTLPLVPASSSVEDVVEIALKRALYSKVQNITLYFKENHSGGREDVTEINYLGFKGDFTKLNREPVIALYEAAAQLEDHKTDVKDRFGMGNQFGV